jgi:ATP-dependent HslUV protease subunit HslV
LAHSELPADQIVEESLRIAADICVYSNHEIVVEKLPTAAAAGTLDEGIR